MIKNKEYYDKLYTKMRKDRKMVDYYAKQVENYKKLYYATKGKRGVYKVLNKFAKRMNEYHYTKGYELATKDMGILEREYDYLEQYIKGIKESAE